MKIPPHIKAILWDMDGVIIDSENYWHQKSHLFYEQFTPHMTVQDQHNITGKNNRDTFAYLKTHYPDDMMDCEYEDYLTRSSAFALGEVYPCCDLCKGVKGLLDRLKSRDMPMAICSSAIRPWVDYAIDRFALETYFAFTLSGDDIERGKPNPEVFLKGATQLALDPSECLVLEDSRNGVQAGVDGGMLVWAYHNEVNELQDLSKAHGHFSDFDLIGFGS